MTLQEAQNILLEMNNINPNYGEDESKIFDFVLDDDKEHFISLYSNIYKICNLKKKSQQRIIIKSLAYNPLVYKIWINKKAYKISTAYGNASFWNSKEIYKSKKYPKYILHNNDYENALFTVVELYKNRPYLNPEILVGIYHHPLNPKNSYPTSFATYQNIEGSRFVLDFNLNICLEECLFKKLTGFTEFERINGELATKILDATNDFISHPSYDDNNQPSFAHALFAPNEYIKYVNEVLNENRPNNFPFGLITNTPFANHNKETNKNIKI